MVKKVFILTALVVLLVASSVSAFDLVERKADTGMIGMGLEGGVAWGPEYFCSFYGVTGNYYFSQQLALKASIGLSTGIAWDGVDYVGVSSIYFTAKPAYYLINRSEVGIYGFAVATNLTSHLLTLGVGLGTEFIKFSDSVKFFNEVSYSVDQIFMYTGGFKIYF